MAISSIMIWILLLVRLAVFCVPLYVLFLAARALRKYLSEPPKGDLRGGSASEGRMELEIGDKRRFWPLGPVSWAVLAVLALILLGMGLGWRGSGAHAVSIIGGADGPTSVFVAGKVGGLHGMHGLLTVVHLGLLAAAVYLIYLIIRALRKYLGQ